MSNKTRKHNQMWSFASLLLQLSILVFGASATAAQHSGASDLEDLVAPIALYPDDLLAVVLPASTYPLQVVQAARFLEDSESDGSLQPDPDWDDSIVALLNYPEVVEMMNEDLDWTWALGEAVIGQESQVLAAVADFREQARNAGNLRSDDRQIVEVIDESIEIRPANPQVIYVPYYEPERVVVYQPVRVVHYYPRRYPVYYYPYPVDYAFYSNRFWGVTSAFSIGWTTRHLHLHYREWDSHPYYGYLYPDRYYYGRPAVVVYNQYVYPRHSGRHHAGNYWQRRHHQTGARPQQRSRTDQQAWQPARNSRDSISGVEHRKPARRHTSGDGSERRRHSASAHDAPAAVVQSWNTRPERASNPISSRGRAEGGDRNAARMNTGPESRPRSEQQQRRSREVVASTPAQPKQDSARTARAWQRKSEEAAPKSERRERGSDSSRSQQKAMASRHENDKLRGRFLK